MFFCINYIICRYFWSWSIFSNSILYKLYICLLIRNFHKNFYVMLFIKIINVYSCHLIRFDSLKFSENGIYSFTQTCCNVTGCKIIWWFLLLLLFQWVVVNLINHCQIKNNNITGYNILLIDDSSRVSSFARKVEIAKVYECTWVFFCFCLFSSFISAFLSHKLKRYYLGYILSE